MSKRKQLKASRLDDRNKDPLVGYGRPPVATQFQIGRSGNPKGRPKGRKNIATILNEILNRKVEVREGNRVRVLTKIEAAIEVHTNKALKGDPRAFAKLIDVAEKLGTFDFAPETPKITEIRRTIVDPKRKSSMRDGST
jgi:hypothetical protein